MGRSLASKIHEANTAILADGNPDKVGEFFSPDYVAHLTGQETMKGLGAVRRFVGMLLRAFPDLRIEVEILVEGKDRVAWQRTLRGTHEGDFMGSPRAVARSCGATW